MVRLVDRLERYLQASGMPATRFGREVANDPRLVFDLRRGRQPRAAIRQRLLAKIGGENDMRRMMDDIQAELLRAVRRTLESDQQLAREGGIPPVTVTALSSQPWFSATFSGERHAIGLCLRGTPRTVAAARERLAARLPATEFDLPGHLVAGIEIVTCEDDGLGRCELRLEALTIAED